MQQNDSQSRWLDSSRRVPRTQKQHPPAFVDILTYQTSVPLASRVVARSHLEPANRSQMEVYINHHLPITGVSNNLFDDTAVTAIHQGSGGLFRKANNLARCALIAAGESRMVDNSRVQVNYYVSGKGDLVVLLPSLGRSASDFNELVGALNKAGFRTAAVEHRGMGKTTGSNLFSKLSLHDYASDAAAALRAVSGPQGKAHVIGHAFGNRVARTLASDHPVAVRSLALLEAGGYVPIPKDIQRSTFMIFFNFLPDSVREKNIRKCFFAPGNRIPDYWIGGWRFSAALPQYRAALKTPLKEWWSGGSAPILLLQAEEDVCAPVGNAKAMKKEFPDRVKIAMIPKAGHALLPEQPDLVRDAVIEFITKH